MSKITDFYKPRRVLVRLKNSLGSEPRRFARKIDYILCTPAELKCRYFDEPYDTWDTYDYSYDGVEYNKRLLIEVVDRVWEDEATIAAFIDVAPHLTRWQLSNPLRFYN